MKNHINLLPFEFRRRQLIRARVGQSCVVAGSAVIAIAVVLWSQHVSLRALRGEATRLDLQCEPLRQTTLENSRIEQRVQELTNRQSLLSEIESTQKTLSLIGIVSRSARRGGSRVQVRQFSVQRIRSVSNNPPAASIKEDVKSENDAQHPQMKLTLSGVAMDDLAVAKFVVALREDGVFNVVELKSSLEGGAGDHMFRQYQIECTL
jgi:hypothetical protein